MKLSILIFSICISYALSSYPVAVFHGIGDSCENSGMRRFTTYFGSKIGAYSKCIETAGSIGDLINSFISQAETACEKIKNDKNFHGDFSVVGISQGALFARYIIETCDMPGKVKRYVSIGGPQMGVGKFPHCQDGILCNILNKIVGMGIYSSYVQSHIGPAGYFKDINNYDTYLKYSTFLPDLNNEKPVKDEKKKERFSALEKMVLIKFSQDTMIIPKETAWFQFINEKSHIVALKDSDFYKNDYIGLRKLVEEEKVNFVELLGDHLNFSYDDVDNYMAPALE